MRVVIGIDPHKRSNTAVVIDRDEQVLARQRFDNDREGHQALRKFGRTWADRTWAVEGSRGVGLGLAQRLAAEGETVLNVPPKLSAKVRAFGGGSGRKTDDTDAYAVALAGLRARGLHLVHVDTTVAVMRLLSERRQQLVEQRIMTVNRLHQLLQDLVSGGAARRLTSKKARELLATVRPRDQVGKARKELALEQIADINALDAKLKAAAKRIAEVFKENPSHVTGIFGIGEVLACLAIGETGDVRRFPSKGHYASYTGTAPVDSSSGDSPHVYVNRGGNRRLNHALHIAALVQTQHEGPGRDYYLRKRAEGKTPLEAMRCLKRRLSDALYRALVTDLEHRLQLETTSDQTADQVTGPGGHSGATLQSSASGPTPAASPSDKSLPGPAEPDATPAPQAPGCCHWTGTRSATRRVTARKIWRSGAGQRPGPSAATVRGRDRQAAVTQVAVCKRSEPLRRACCCCNGRARTPTPRRPSMLDAQTQLLRAREAALVKYAGLTSPANIAAHFDEIVEEFGRARIRTYVPVLAERRLREVLIPEQAA